MATTVAQHSVATFTSPVNGTTPIDANTVRGNDNTVRSSYNDHDADPGIHVQSSTLASRPVAGTAGRKWITEDSGVYTLWFDDGTNWHPVSSENVALTVLAGENLVKGDVVKVTGWNNGQDLPEVVKTTSAADTAFAVITATVSSGSMGYATNTGIVQDVNTAAYSVGTILYANGSGGFTSTKPTSGNYQPVAYVLRANASNGVYYVEFSTPRIVERSDNTASTIVLRDASGNFSAGTITASLTGSISGNAATATALQTARNINGVSFNGTADITVTAAAGTLTGTTLASNVVSSSLTSVGTLANLTVTNPITGSVTGSSGSTTGNAATATALQTARTINGVSFNGTADITVTAAAGTLTGTTLASGVTASSLQSVGTLSSLTVSGGLTVDPNTLVVDATNNLLGFGDTPSTSVFTGSSGVAPKAQVVATDNTTTLNLTTASLVIQNESTTDNTGAALNFVSRNTGSTRVAHAAIYGLTGTRNTGWNTGSLVFALGSPSAAPAEQMRLTTTGLGVGTSSPISRLHVNTSGSVVSYTTIGNNNNGLVVGVNTDGSGRIGSYAGNVAIDFGGSVSTTWASRMLLDASGNLGLGVTPSAWASGYRALQVVQGALVQTGGFTILSNNYFDDGTPKYITSDTASYYIQVSGEHRWANAASGTAGNAITFSRTLTLDASGNVLVGATSSPGTLNKQLVINSGASALGGFGIQNNTTGTAFNDGGWLYLNGADLKITNFETAPIIFETNGNNERARITSGGYFKASDVGTYNDATGSYHEFRNSTNNGVIYVHNTNASFTDGAFVVRTTKAAGTDFDLIVGQANSVTRFNVRGDGNAFNTNGSYGTISDATIKQDIVDAPSQWADLKAIQFRKYRLKDQVAQDANAPYLLGVVAQELEQVSPGLVDEDRDGIKAVKSSILLMKAAVALQEAMARIETLEQRVLALGA